MLPEWAAGFWQSKLRYRTQDELLAVAREYHARGLPLSVIVADFFHWTHLGDWRFDPAEWPDPAAMVRELDDLGVKLMVSVWPSVSPLSENYRALHEQGLLVAAENGVPAHAPWKDKGFDVEMPVAFYDATNPAARQFVWGNGQAQLLRPGRPRVVAGRRASRRSSPATRTTSASTPARASEVFNIYPQAHAQAFHDGMPRRRRRRGGAAEPVGVGGQPALRRGAVVRATSRRPGSRCARRCGPG